jgi:hypothetical protein
MQNEARGVIDHMAFSLSNLESVVDALSHHEIEFELRRHANLAAFLP